MSCYSSLGRAEGVWTGTAAGGLIWMDNAPGAPGMDTVDEISMRFLMIFVE